MRTGSDLFSMVCDGYNLQRGWSEVRHGKTSPARRRSAGIDGVSIAQWEQDWPARLRQLQTELIRGEYQPAPLLWFDIPRSEPGRYRRLGIPTITDRVAQRTLKNVLEPFYEVQFLSCSHGFRPGRSVETAVSHVLWHVERGRCWVADADIQAYFDSVDHARLLAMLEHLGEPRVIGLIAAWLERGAASPGKGIAQGAVISPLLANVYLHPLDVALVSSGAALVRYADDLVVMCSAPGEAVRALQDVAVMLNALNLDLNREKSTVRPFGPDFEFLGARFEM